MMWGCFGNEEILSLEGMMRDLHMRQFLTERAELEPPHQAFDFFGQTSQHHHKNWEIDPREIILFEKLGEGAFGVVRRGEWQRKKVAVKLMKVNRMSKDEFIREARVMMSLQHPHVVKLYGVSLRSKPIYIVTEFMEHGALLTYLRDHKNSFSQQLLTKMCYQVSLGMKYLEENNYIHRDLAARNCLVALKRCVKIADFGLSRYVPYDLYSGHTKSLFAGKWASPEVLCRRHFSNKSDVWSFGILMWEIFTYGDEPYGDLNNKDLVREVISGYKLGRPYSCPKNIYEIMLFCWENDPDERPTFKQLVQKLKNFVGSDTVSGN